jgi:molybdopterin-guanine dinucleotide biosynthesis protein A
LIGALLAGGEGSRLGRSSKPAAILNGRPLASYPYEALSEVCDRVAVVCKKSTELPELEGAERWDEPDEPRHPLTGIIHALETADEPVLVCAADMPYVTADACRSLITAPNKAIAMIAAADGRLQPTFGVYAPQALEALKQAPEDAPLTETVEHLNPTRVAFPAQLVKSINTKEDLEEAERAGAQ